MRGTLRVRRLVVVSGGTFVAGVFTGELRDADGSVIGVDTRRATIAAELVRHGDGYLPVLQPFQLDLMGIVVDVHATTVDTHRTQPVRTTAARPRRSGGAVRPAAAPMTKLLALLTPCAMLAVLWGLQRLEVWMVRTTAPAHHRRLAARSRHPGSSGMPPTPGPGRG